MNADHTQYISAHSAAVKLAHHKMDQGLMTSEQANQFTDMIYFLVNTGQLPDDPKLLALTDEQWKIATSQAYTETDIVDLIPN